MTYTISYDAKTRNIGFNGLESVTEGDTHSNILILSKNDLDGLTEGYDAYCVFDDGTRIRFEDDRVVLPDFKDKRKVFIQLCFEKEGEKFYSLNILVLRVKRAII